MRGLAILSRYLPTNSYIVDCEPSQSKDKHVPFSPFLQAYFNMAESLTPSKVSRASPHTSKVPSTQETVAEEFLRFYKKPLQVEVDIGSLSIDKKKKKYDQIRKYQQKRVDEVKRSLLANPPEEPVTVTAWQSPGT